jgi:hypothetical protein
VEVTADVDHPGQEVPCRGQNFGGPLSVHHATIA